MPLRFDGRVYWCIGKYWNVALVHDAEGFGCREPYGLRGPGDGEAACCPKCDALTVEPIPCPSCKTGILMEQAFASWKGRIDVCPECRRRIASAL